MTEYIYCQKCLEAVKTVLVADEKYLKGIVIPGWTGMSELELPIIAGKMGGLWPGDEIFTFEREYGPEIAEAVCHPVRVAVLGDEGTEVFLLSPGGRIERMLANRVGNS